MTHLEEQLSALNKMSRGSVALYHRFALSIGVSDSALGVLYALLAAGAPCAQNDLCEEWSVPKQTVNSAISVLGKKGLVSLSHISGARNKKSVALTDRGRAFAEETVGRLRALELDALAELSDGERALYIRLNEKYNRALAEALDGLLGE